MSTNRLKDKTALVTGASRGIGYAIAKRFASEGAHVICIARNSNGLEKLDDEIKALGGSATLVPLDVTDGDKIDELGYQLFKRFGKLDILVGNAGILGTLSPLTHIKPKEWDQVLSVNLTANFRLLRSMEALLNAAETPRVIFVTSEVAAEPHAYWGTYAISKAALEEMAKIYAAENRTKKIKVNLVDPGTVSTKMLAAAFPGEDMTRYTKPDEVTEIFVTLSEDSQMDTGKLYKAQ